jgi:hypothetical protein
VIQAGPGGRAERYVPRGYWIPAALRILLPSLVRRAVAGGGFTTATASRSGETGVLSAAPSANRHG